MTHEQPGENDAGVPVSGRPEAEQHETDAALSDSKQPGWLRRQWNRSKTRPPWWVEQLFGAGIVGLLVSVLVGGTTFVLGKHFSDIQARQTLHLDNVRFVRERVANTPNQRFQFAGLDLEGQDLYLLPLSHANFRDAKLSRALLAGADLTGADLMGADLRGANLSGANLDGANLCAADLSGAFVDSALLRGAILAGANLTEANFQHTVLTGAKFVSSEFQMDEHTQEGCESDRSNLTKTDLLYSDLAGADLKEVAPSLTSANLSHIYYDGKTIWPDWFRPPPSDSTPYQVPPPLGQIPPPREQPNPSQRTKH